MKRAYSMIFTPIVKSFSDKKFSVSSFSEYNQVLTPFFFQKWLLPNRFRMLFSVASEI